MSNKWGFYCIKSMCSMIKRAPYIKPMRHFGETIKYNYVSLITHSSTSGAVANKAFQCLTISYSLLFISFAFSHLTNIYLTFSGTPPIYNFSLWSSFCTFVIYIWPTHNKFKTGNVSGGYLIWINKKFGHRNILFSNKEQFIS